MNEVKLYVKFPAWIFGGYVFLLAYAIVSTIYIIVYESTDVVGIVSGVLLIIMVGTGLIIIIQTNYNNKMYFSIDSDGISYEQYVFFKKRNLKWNEELYYMVTDKFFSVYSYKKMSPLTGGIINKDNKEHGIYR
jgi:hypothetical protein